MSFVTVSFVTNSHNYIQQYAVDWQRSKHIHNTYRMQEN